MGGSGSHSKAGGDQGGGLTPSALHKLAQLWSQLGAQWAKGLTETDQRAFAAFQKFNRDFQAGLQTDTLSPNEKRVVDRLNRAIDRSHTERDMIGFISAKGSPRGIVKEGGSIKMKTFVNANLNSSKVSQTDTLYRVRIPKGASAAYLPSVGIGKSPAFILKSGATYRVDKMRQKGGRDIVDLTYLG